MTKENKIKLFTDRVVHYQEFFGLIDYELTVFEQDKWGVRASYYVDMNARIVSICWSKEWISDKDTDQYEIDRVAFHEVFELYLYELRQLASDPSIWRDESEVDKRTHIIVRVAENRILPLIGLS